MRLPARESCALLFAQARIEAETVAALARDIVHVCITEDAVEPVTSPLRLVSAITLTEVGRVVNPS
jgi:hypothetical protein